MKKVTTRRRFHPYASRKNRKRALGVRQRDNQPVAPRTEGFAGMGAELLQSIMRSARGQ